MTTDITTTSNPLAAAKTVAKRVKRIQRQGPHIVRVTITFSEAAIEWLDDEAASRAISLADLLRRIVDETRGSYIVEPKLKPSTAQLIPDEGAGIIDGGSN